MARCLGLADEDTRHETVNHCEKSGWSVGSVHRHTIEGIWSPIKRSSIGAVHKISVRHLDAYLQEMAFRFDNHDKTHKFRDLMKRILAGEALRYEALTARESA